MRSPGNGQRLGPRSGHDGARHQRRHLGHRHVVEDERAVGLVADDHDRLAGAGEHRLDLDVGRRGIDDAAGIVRRVQDDGTRARRDRRLQPGHVRREVGLRGHHDQPAPVVLRVEGVLDEERRDREHLVARVEQRLQHGVQRRAGAHGHEDVAGRVRQPRGGAQPPGHRLPHARVAGVGHVGVQVELAAVQHPAGRGQHGRGRLDLRVAQREVEDLVGAPLLLEARALLEHPADPGGLGEIGGDRVGDDHAGSIGHLARPGGEARRGMDALRPGFPSATLPTPMAAQTSGIGDKAESDRLRTVIDEGLADAGAADPFRLPRRVWTSRAG